jgi:dTDP-L-rhamnose 4-epimerase
LSYRILILGGAGFIGSHLAAELVRLGHEVTIFSRNPNPDALDSVSQGLSQSLRIVRGSLNDAEKLSQLLTGAEVVYHNAAYTGVEASASDPLACVETNIKGTCTLANLLRSGRHSVQKLVLASSISVYGEGNYFCHTCGTVRPPLRFDRDQFGASKGWDPKCPNCGGIIAPRFTPENADRFGESMYAITKKAQEDLMLSTSHLIDVPFICFRYCTVFGPNQPDSSPYSRFIRLLLEGCAPRVFEDGNQSRDFIYISDVVNANVLPLSQDVSGYFNIGSGVQTPLIEFVDQMRKSLEKHIGRRLPDPEITGTLCRGDVRHCYADVSKAKAELDFSNALDLDSGIERLTSSFSRHQAASGTRP